MSANAPLLAKFARRPFEEKAKPNSAKVASEKWTYITKVERETTDDQ